ncbi:hypothetical protein ACTXT7_006938 [Hymenolepis weldensis]
MQQNPHENTPPSSPKMRTGGEGEKTTSCTVVIPPPTTTTLPHTFDAKGISDFESLPTSSSLDRRRLDEKKISTITAGTTASGSRPEDEEEDSDVDKLLMESPTATGNNGHRQRVTSSLRFGTNRSGHSDSGIFDTSSPGSTATHSLARSTTSSKKRPSVRPVVRDMYSEYTTSTPLPERAVKRARTVLSIASISLKPAADASSSTDDFYYPLDASVLLPTQRATPLIVHRANISTPPLIPYPTTKIYIQPTGNDQETQTATTAETPGSRPPKAKRKSVTKRFTLFHSAKTSTQQRQQPLVAHKTLNAPSNQLRSEHTIELSTCGAQVPKGIILVKSTAAVAAPGLPNFAAEAAATVMDEKPDATGERVLQTEGELPKSARVTPPGGLEAISDRKSLESPHSGDESADSLEASWYQPHLRHSVKAKRFHKRVRRKLKHDEESHGTERVERDKVANEYDQRNEEIKTSVGHDQQKGDVIVDIQKTKVIGQLQTPQMQHNQTHTPKELTETDVIAIQEKELSIQQYEIHIKKRYSEKGKEDKVDQDVNKEGKTLKKNIKIPKIKTGKQKLKTTKELQGTETEDNKKAPKVDVEKQIDVEESIIPIAAAKRQSMQMDEPSADVELASVGGELPEVVARADISPLEMEMSVPKPEIEKPFINFYPRKPNSKSTSDDGQNVVLRTDFPSQSAASPCVSATLLPSYPLYVNVPHPDALSSSFASSEIYGKDSFDIIEKDLKVPSYSVRLFKDRPSPIALSSSPADDHRLNVNFEDTDRDVIRTDYAPAKPQREFAISERDKRADEKIGTDEIDGTSKSPNAFISPSGEMYSASASPREVRAYPSSSDITASELESSSQGESMPMSPRDFYAHSATPEFKRITDAEIVEEEGNIKKKNMFNWFHLSWRRNKRRKSAVSTSSGVEDGRSPSTTGKRNPKHQKHKERKPTTEDEDLGIQADITLVTIPKTEVVSKAEPALPREAELILAEQKSATAEAQAEAPKSHESKGLFPKKRSKKHKKIGQVTPTSSTKFETSPRMRQPSSSAASEHQFRQTWHHSEMKVSPISEVDQHTPPPPPIPRHLDDEISEWLARAYRSHYAEGSPLRKPRPWSTLDFPPRNCTFLNDDYLFPYSITPTKLPSCQWKSDKEYNVPYIDDDALPLDEPEWALGESRRTLTLTSADADFWRSAIAEEEKSDASGEGAWGLKKHSKKYRSLIPFSHKDRSSKEQDVIRRPRLLNPPTESPSQGFRKKLESTQHQEPPQTHY